MEAKSVNFKQAKGIKSAFLVILCCFILAVCIFHFVLGNPANFMNNDPNNHPLPGNMLGTIYKGGVIVPVIQTLSLIHISTLSRTLFTEAVLDPMPVSGRHRAAVRVCREPGVRQRRRMPDNETF